MATGQCRHSPAAPLPRAPTPHGRLVVIAPIRARNPDMMGKGARMPSTIRESCPAQQKHDIMTLSYCACCPCRCRVGCPNCAGHPPVTAVCSSLLSMAQPTNGVLGYYVFCCFSAPETTALGWKGLSVQAGWCMSGMMGRSCTSRLHLQ